MSEVRASAPRPLEAPDLDGVVAIDARQTGQAKPEYWERVFVAFLDARVSRTFGFGMDDEHGHMVGFVFGEVRAFEFGSEPCGWVFAVGIDEAHRRRGLASRLLEAAMTRFRELGVGTVRTMVRRNDIPVLSFFRSGGFVGGPYVQLERGVDDGRRS